MVFRCQVWLSEENVKRPGIGFTPAMLLGLTSQAADGVVWSSMARGRVAEHIFSSYNNGLRDYASHLLKTRTCTKNGRRIDGLITIIHATKVWDKDALSMPTEMFLLYPDQVYDFTSTGQRSPSHIVSSPWLRNHPPDEAPVILCQLQEDFAFLRQEKLLWLEEPPTYCCNKSYGRDNK